MILGLRLCRDYASDIIRKPAIISRLGGEMGACYGCYVFADTRSDFWRLSGSFRLRRRELSGGYEHPGQVHQSATASPRANPRGTAQGCIIGYQSHQIPHAKPEGEAGGQARRWGSGRLGGGLGALDGHHTPARRLAGPAAFAICSIDGHGTSRAHLAALVADGGRHAPSRGDCARLLPGVRNQPYRRSRHALRAARPAVLADRPYRALQSRRMCWSRVVYGDSAGQ